MTGVKNMEVVHGYIDRANPPIKWKHGYHCMISHETWHSFIVRLSLPKSLGIQVLIKNSGAPSHETITFMRH